MNSSVPNIFLIGPMGSGKTTIGKRLAEMLNLNFFDCDQELESITGASVNLIFDVEGESGFRQRETRLLNQLAVKKGVLISTGGGVVCAAENRRILRTMGFVVYLKTSVEHQLKRLSQDKSRPLLQADDKLQRLGHLARVRDPLYDASADLVFQTSNESVYTTAKSLSCAILEQLEPFNADR